MILETQGITVRRAGAARVDDASLGLAAGELVGLIGPNGAGKSTLLSVAAGLMAPDRGRRFLNRRPLSDYSGRERGRRMAWLEQGGRIHWPLTVERLVMLGRLPHSSAWRRPRAADLAVVERVLADTDCLHLRARDCTTLSGGERARVLLARALAAEPSILLADEPIAMLDLGHQLQTMELLRGFARGARGCIAVLHDLSLAARYCDRLCLMDRGRMVAQGEPATVLSAANLRGVYGVEVISGRDEMPWIVPVRRVEA